MTVCNTFQQLAVYTWTQIKRSRKVNYQLKEETLTDMIVLELKRKHGHQIITHTFSRYYESRNGADWEWWFNHSGKWIGFRVQAKIINNKSNEFEHLHYKGKTALAHQCDTLIHNALSTSPPKIPLYSLFLSTDDKSLLKTWFCNTFKLDRKLWGCSLINAFDVYKLRSSNIKHLRDLDKLIRPWHCLVCCSGYKSNDKIQQMENYAKVNFSLDSNIAKELNIDIPESFITENPPSYVVSLFKNEDAEIQPPDENLDGILIISLESNNDIV